MTAQRRLRAPYERTFMPRSALDMSQIGWRTTVAHLADEGTAASLQSVITCVVEYVIDPAKIGAFERFARRWMELVNLHGGTHHGYFLPAEGASDQALALFSFPSLAAYEQYRAGFGTDPEFAAADRIRDKADACSVTNGPSCAHCFPVSRTKRGSHSDSCLQQAVT